MATISDLVELLSEQLDVDREYLERAVDALRREGKMPPDGGDIAPAYTEAVARLLVGSMATDWPMLVADAADVYAHLPARVFMTKTGNDPGGDCTLTDIDKVPVVEGQEFMWGSMTGNLIEAVTTTIRFCSGPERLPARFAPRSLTVRRSLRAPFAALQFGDSLVPGFERTLFYVLHRSEDARYVFENSRLTVSAEVPGSIILAIGDLLAGRDPDVDVADGRAAASGAVPTVSEQE